jgi:non-ribosomal peptide synthetase component F
MTISLTETPDGLVGDIEYATDLFERGSIERIAARLVRVLDAIVADPTRLVSGIDVLAPDERRQLLFDSNTETVWEDYALDESTEGVDH